MEALQRVPASCSSRAFLPQTDVTSAGAGAGTKDTGVAAVAADGWGLGNTEQQQDLWTRHASSHSRTLQTMS